MDPPGSGENRMKRKQLLAIIALGASLATGPALASDIYRYVDEDGNVHYGDRPTGDPTEQRMAIVSRPTDNSVVQARYNTRYADPESSGETTDPTTIEPAGNSEPLTRAERAKARQDRANKCQKYRDQLETLMTSRRLFREDADGERSYLEEDEIQEARDKAQELVVENCD